MPHIKATKPVVIARTFLWLALAIAVFALPGCTSCRTKTGKLPDNQSSTNNNQSSTDNRNSHIPDRCHTAVPSLARRQEIGEILKRRRETTPMERPAGSVTIRVYFHVLTNVDGEGNVPQAVLEEQISVLNKAFSGTAGPVGTVGANTPFRFVYAGMEKTENNKWFDMTYNVEPSREEKCAKAKLNRGDKSTLNVYTARVPGTSFGWTRWPWDFADGVDGIVIRYTTLPGGSSSQYNEGDTLTHEVGHWLGLYHTFQGACDAPGDEVADTWPEEYPAKDCPTSKDTCEDNELDPIRNFMNYSTDECMYKFTRNQSDRMDTVHLEYRTP